jgi:hypothetical protein
MIEMGRTHIAHPHEALPDPSIVSAVFRTNGEVLRSDGVRWIKIPNTGPTFTPQSFRTLLTAGEKRQIDFVPAFKAKPIYRVWGYKVDDENYDIKPTVYEVTKDHIILSSELDSVANFQAFETASEYVTGKVVS